MSFDPQSLRYTREQVAELLGCRNIHNLNRATASRPGFPAKLPGTAPPLWSRVAVDAWFNSDAGRRHLAEAPDEGRIGFQSPDDLEAEKRFLDHRYGGR